MLCLQQVEGRTYNPSQQPEKILLKPTVTRFGRSKEHADVVIDSTISPLIISRLHAAIHCTDGQFKIECKGQNGLLVNRKKRSSAVLCEGDEIVFGGAGVKAKEGERVTSCKSELVYVFTEVIQNNSEETNSLGEGTSDGRVLRRSKRKQPVSTSEELSGPPEKKSKSKRKNKEVIQDTDHEQLELENKDAKEAERSKKCLAELNEELLCCICRELMVLAHTLPCSHTFCFGCIRDWLCQSRDCPNCRAAAQLNSAVPVKVLDNTINKVAEEVLSAEELEERKCKIEEMSEEVKKKAAMKKIKVLTVSSDSDSEDDDLDDSDSDVSLDFEEIFGGPEFHYDYRYGVEHARSGRALCRTCFVPIPLSTVRWVVQFKTRWEHHQQTHYHHLDCFSPPERVRYNYLAISHEVTRAERRLVKERMGER